MSFGENIQKLRRQAGLSQEVVADKLSVTRQTISKWELDQSTPDLPYIVKLGELFGVTTDLMIKGEAPAVPTAAETPECGEKRPARVCPQTVFAALLILVGCAGILTCVILSASHPVSYLGDAGAFQGLAGWLFAKEMWGFFAACCAGALAGAAILLDGCLKAAAWGKTISVEVRLCAYAAAAGGILKAAGASLARGSFDQGMNAVADLFLWLSLAAFVVLGLRALYR